MRLFCPPLYSPCTRRQNAAHSVSSSGMIAANSTGSAARTHKVFLYEHCWSFCRNEVTIRQRIRDFSHFMCIFWPIPCLQSHDYRSRTASNAHLLLTWFRLCLMSSSSCYDFIGRPLIPSNFVLTHIHYSTFIINYGDAICNRHLFHVFGPHRNNVYDVGSSLDSSLIGYQNDPGLRMRDCGWI